MAAYSDDNSVKMHFGYVRVCGRVTVIPVEVRRLAGGLGGAGGLSDAFRRAWCQMAEIFFEKDV